MNRDRKREGHEVRVSVREIHRKDREGKKEKQEKEIKG